MTHGKSRTDQHAEGQDRNGADIPLLHSMSPAKHWASRLLGIWSQKQPAKLKPTSLSHFSEVMKRAARIAETNPRGLPGLARALLRPLQSEYLVGVAELGQDAYPTIDSHNFFGGALRPYFYEQGHHRARKLESEPYKLLLGRDTVLPWPWSECRYESALATIGSEKEIPGCDDYFQPFQGPWVQDANHVVELWLPWGIGFVSGGNHSIAAGILSGEGEIKPSSVYDMSYLFEEIRYDGRGFVDIRSGKQLGPAKSWRIGAAFEVGRMMVEHGIRAPAAILTEGAAKTGTRSATPVVTESPYPLPDAQVAERFDHVPQGRCDRR
jgi:hypothetical protein